MLSSTTWTIARYWTALLLSVALLLVLGVTETQAQGFGVFEQGACSMGRAETGVAQPCHDASALFFNPAGLAGHPGITASLGTTVVAAFGGYTDDVTGEETDLDNDPIIVPHLFASYGVNERLAVGLGVYVPYGLGTQWPQDFEGAFLGYDNHLQSIYIQPTIAYQITDRIAAGAGIDVVVGAVELNQLVDLSEQRLPTAPDFTFGQIGIPPGTAFASAGLEGTATGFGANLGVTVEAADWLHVGARYMLPVTLDYDGDATFTQVSTGLVLPAENPLGVPAGTPLDAVVAGQFEGEGALRPQGVETSITMPAQFVIGTSVRASRWLTLYLDYQWTGWSAFDEIVIDFEVAPETTQEENYENTHAVRIGLDYNVSEAFQAHVGYLYNLAAAPEETVTPLLPEADRNHLTAGFSWDVAEPLTVHLAYQYLNQYDVRGRVRELPEDESLPFNTGLYSFGAHLIAATLTLHL